MKTLTIAALLSLVTLTGCQHNTDPAFGQMMLRTGLQIMQQNTPQYQYRPTVQTYCNRMGNGNYNCSSY